MRIVKYTSRFRRDYRREKSGRHGERVDAALLETVAMLAKDEPLPRRYFDHPLSGEWSDHRDCHIRPDLILIYRKPAMRVLSLSGSARTASLAYSFFRQRDDPHSPIVSFSGSSSFLRLPRLAPFLHEEPD